MDDRVKVSIPAVMISSHFFGSCSCESGMPINNNGITTNVEIACLAAPRPMLLISDGADWTKNTETVEYPFVQHIYKLYNKEYEVENVHLIKEAHDYGINKRLAAYSFLAKHLGLNTKNITDKNGKISEDFVTLLDGKELTYFNEQELASLLKGDAVYEVFVNSKK